MAAISRADSSFDGGYDCDFVEVPPKFLECCICLLPLRDPHVLSCCGLKACEPCLRPLKAGRHPCPTCRQKFVTMLEKEVQRKVLDLLVYCSRRKKGCEWKGELRSLDTHSRSECGCVEVGCRYNCGGRFQRRLLQNHETEECPRCPPEVKRMNMMRKTEAKINKLSVEFEDRLGNIKEMYERQIMELRNQNAALQEDRKELWKRINEIEGQLQSQSASRFSRDGPSWPMMPHQGTLSSPYPPCQIIMPYFSNYKKSSTLWSSLPFYSTQGGYKMNLLVAANGLRNAHATHVSVVVCLLKGENDDQLKIPFEGRVTFAVVNWRSNENHIVITVPFTNTPVEGQANTTPESHLYKKLIPNLLPHSALGFNATENTQYLHEDRLCFRVLSVTVADEEGKTVESHSFAKSKV